MYARGDPICATTLWIEQCTLFYVRARVSLRSLHAWWPVYSCIFVSYNIHGYYTCVYALSKSEVERCPVMYWNNVPSRSFFSLACCGRTERSSHANFPVLATGEYTWRAPTQGRWMQFVLSAMSVFSQFRHYPCYPCDSRYSLFPSVFGYLCQMFLECHKCQARFFLRHSLAGCTLTVFVFKASLIFYAMAKRTGQSIGTNLREDVFPLRKKLACALVVVARR